MIIIYIFVPCKQRTRRNRVILNRKNMEAKNEIRQNVVMMRCLSLLFYNFQQDRDIKPLRESCFEFNHCWHKLEKRAALKKWDHISDKEFYSLFVDVSYETQAIIIQHALKIYKEEAERQVSFTLKIRNELV